MDNETWRSAGRRTLPDGDDCRYGANTDFSVLDSAETYCDRYECVLRTTCGMYRAAYGPQPISDIEVEFIDDGGEQVDMDGEADPLSDTELELLRMYQNVRTIDVNPF